MRDKTYDQQIMSHFFQYSIGFFFKKCSANSIPLSLLRIHEIYKEEVENSDRTENTNFK